MADDAKVSTNSRNPVIELLSNRRFSSLRSYNIIFYLNVLSFLFKKNAIINFLDYYFSCKNITIYLFFYSFKYCIQVFQSSKGCLFFQSAFVLNFDVNIERAKIFFARSEDNKAGE